MNKIPRISFKKLKDNNLDAFKNLSEALRFHGFFSIYDHQIQKVHIAQCYSKSQEFFKLDLDIKNKYAFPEIGGARGYTPFGKETALGEDVPDLKEFWHHGPVLDNFFDHRVYDNIQIKEVDDFNSVFDQLFNDLNNLGSDLLSFIAISIPCFCAVLGHVWFRGRSSQWMGTQKIQIQRSNRPLHPALATDRRRLRAGHASLFPLHG